MSDLTWRTAAMNPVLEQLKFMNKIEGLGRRMKMRRNHSLTRQTILPIGD